LVIERKQNLVISLALQILHQDFSISKKKNMLVNKAMDDNSWITNIDLQLGFDVEHFQQFSTL
jgi:hypothetical protein